MSIGSAANLGDLIGELNNRRRDALDIRLQFRHHAGRLVLVGAVADRDGRGRHRAVRRHACGAGGRCARGPAACGKALRRALAHPEHLAERRPSVPRKIAAAGGSAVATAIGKRLARRLVSA